ncbi:MAG: hypothetical protein ACREOK_06165, partial [Gemmatimonadaceae bacterium]
RLYSPGVTDREVPTMRSVEGSGGADLTARGMYGDGGISAGTGMPSSVPASGGAPRTGDGLTGRTGSGGGELP